MAEWFASLRLGGRVVCPSRHLSSDRQGTGREVHFLGDQGLHCGVCSKKEDSTKKSGAGLELQDQCLNEASPACKARSVP